VRILFTSTAGPGHLNPLFPLARAARAAGHDVLFAVPGTAVERPARLGFAAAATDDGIPSPAEMAFWQSLPTHQDGNTAVIGEYFGRLRPIAVLESTGTIVADFRPDVIVSEQAEFAGRLQAELCGLPHVTVGIMSTDLAGCSVRPLIDNLDAIRASIGLPANGEHPWYEGTQYVTGVPRVLQMSSVPLPAGTVRYRYEDAEGAPPAPGPVRIGRRRVYATLGTAAARQPMAAPAFSALVAALGDVDADVVFTAGDFDPSRLWTVPPNVRVAAYLPQSETMDVDVVVGHGGAGTTSAALSRGIPIVAVPLFADQGHNAGQVVQAGAGVVVDARRIDTDLAPAVATVLGDPSFRAAAGRIAAENAALPSAAAVLGLVLGERATPVRRAG